MERGSNPRLSEVLECYTTEHNLLNAMLPITLQVPLMHLESIGVLPMTRDSVIEFARRTIMGPAREVHIAVTADHEYDGLVIELATVELNAAPDGCWRLQYVSHPAQSSGLTKSISPCESDIDSFIQAREIMRPPQALIPFCAEELEAEGLGPLAVLSLRLDNPAPVVPTRADLDRLVALANLPPSL